MSVLEKVSKLSSPGKASGSMGENGMSQSEYGMSQTFGAISLNRKSNDAFSVASCPLKGQSNDEKEVFTNFINSTFKDDIDLTHRLPIDKCSMRLFAECTGYNGLTQDGIILAKLINVSVPGTIDERVLNLEKNKNALSIFHKTENNNLVINSAKAIGCTLVNIGNSDLLEGRAHLILGIIWQILNVGLRSRIDLRVHPELLRIVNAGESVEEFGKASTDSILMRWFNHHLVKAGHSEIKNFSSDLKDGEKYTIILNQLRPDLCNLDALNSSGSDRVELVLKNADKMGCRKFVTVNTILDGNQKLNVAFVSNLFHNYPGLGQLNSKEMSTLKEYTVESDGDQEANIFSLWLNSLGCEPYVHNLFDDLCDGLVLLSALDKINPGLVEWKRVNKPFPVKSKFKKLENCNYVLELSRRLKFSLVAVQGDDIVVGSKKLTLGLVWQLMRHNIIGVLKTLSSGGKDVTDNDIIKWANEMVNSAGRSKLAMKSFKDPSLSTSHFFLELINAIKPGVVCFKLIITDTNNEEGNRLNANYAISLARKLGATIFLGSDDIVNILTFVGSLMAIAKKP